MTETYKIVDIQEDMDNPEDLGTKEKFWYRYNNQKWLFKKSRPLTGEHWSEKVAEQLCQQLGIPHAKYELARYQGDIGITSLSIIEDRGKWRMTLGNQLLMMEDSSYPGEKKGRFVRVKEHTVYKVLGILDSAKTHNQPPAWPCLPDSLDAAGVFVGYLLLDALISNQDRHHENWAILLNGETGEQFLCPSYDHASSLGCTEPDKKRLARLTTKDKGYNVEAYVSKATCALYKSKSDAKPLKTIEAFRLASRQRPKAARYWLEQLKMLDKDRIRNILAKVPDEVTTPAAMQFAEKIILENRRSLLCALN